MHVCEIGFEVFLTIGLEAKLTTSNTTVTISPYIVADGPPDIIVAYLQPTTDSSPLPSKSKITVRAIRIHNFIYIKLSIHY